MKLGFIVLAHQDLNRAEQLVRHLAQEGCAVAVHIDKQVSNQTFQIFRQGLEDCEEVVFSKRRACEWGRFSLVQATLDAAEALLNHAPGLDHVFLISGSCLPIRPIRQLRRFLSRNAKTDYIESVSVANNFWVKDGLNEERFTLYFPFSWRRQRKLFDRAVSLQRRLGIERQVPKELDPHIGSQWWCLTARTLRKILDDPRRAYFDNYFRRAWIPDESYFQTLARLHAHKIENRSLTFSKFDYLGRPFVLYDDHINVLSQSDCFMARKIWPGAEVLYTKLLDEKRANQPMSRANPPKFAAQFDTADQHRCEGGVGRFHQGRFPFNQADRTGVCESPYSVFVGFKPLYNHFPEWLEATTDALAFGSVFARTHVSGRSHDQHFAGNLPAEVRVRNRNPKGFLANLLWPHRDRHQSLLFDFRDKTAILPTIVFDPMATVVLIRHSWVVRLLNRDVSFENTLANARRYYALEQKFLQEFAHTNAEARLVTLPLEFAVSQPGEALAKATEHMGSAGRGPRAMPERTNIEGLDALIRKLRNNGLPIDFAPPPKRKETEPRQFSKPFVVK